MKLCDKLCQLWSINARQYLCHCDEDVSFTEIDGYVLVISDIYINIKLWWHLWHNLRWEYFRWYITSKLFVVMPLAPIILLNRELALSQLMGNKEGSILYTALGFRFRTGHVPHLSICYMQQTFLPMDTCHWYSEACMKWPASCR